MGNSSWRMLAPSLADWWHGAGGAPRCRALGRSSGSATSELDVWLALATAWCKALHIDTGSLGRNGWLRPRRTVRSPLPPGIQPHPARGHWVYSESSGNGLASTHCSSGCSHFTFNFFSGDKSRQH